MGNDGSITSIIPILPENTILPVTDTSDSDNSILMHQKKQTCSSSEEIEDMNMPDFDINELLQLAPIGKAIISFYNANNYLNDCLRNKLVDIIMRKLFSFHCKQYI